jgi:hypothetical protein
MEESLKIGQVTIKEKDVQRKFIKLEQGMKSFFGRYEESVDGSYIAAFNDGYLQRTKNGEEWIAGTIYLIRGTMVLWRKNLERPNDAAVANNGSMVVNDWLYVKQKLGGKFYVFNQKGDLVLQKQFDSNLCSCAITKEGNYAVVSTAFPENTIHFFDINNCELKWSYKNHSREVVLGLSFLDDKIRVMTGKSVATRKYNFSLDFLGNLGEEDAMRLEQVRKISKGVIEDSISMLVSFLDSSDKNQVLRGLNELRASTSRFNKHSRVLAAHVANHILDEDKEISQISEDTILKFGEKDAGAVEPAVQTILKRIDTFPDEYQENDLRLLGMLGKIKPQWIRNRIPWIIGKLRNSAMWNERRFAAISIGMIGSTDPELVKEAVPIIEKYLGDGKWWVSEIVNKTKLDSKVSIDLNVAYGMGVDPEVWVRDAAIGSLGDIGEQDPEIVKDTIPEIIRCLSRSEQYTRKKAIYALNQISKKGRVYVEPVIPILQEIYKNDKDDKVKSEAQKLLNALGHVTS